MLQKMRIPEVGQRDRFIRRCVKDGAVLTLGSEELASVPSQKYADRIVQLFWSSPIEARRWGEALAGADDLQELSLATFCIDILPGLAAAKGLVGTDWVADPIEAEIDPADLRLRLLMEALNGHLAAVAEQGEVFIVANDDGPVLEPADGRGADVLRLPIFVDRKAADGWAAAHSGAWTTVDALADLIASTLPWAAARGHMAALTPVAGAGFVELAPDMLIARLARCAPPAADAAPKG